MEDLFISMYFYFSLNLNTSQVLIIRLIQHAKYLLARTNEKLCLCIIHALKSMVTANHSFDTMVWESALTTIIGVLF